MERQAVLTLSLLGLAACGLAPPAEEPRPLTGLVDATEIDVASKVPGRVKAVHVREGDAVTAGQPLVEIESDEIQAKLAQVQATIAASEAKLKLAHRGARTEERDAVKRQLDSARHQVAITKKMYDRMAALSKADSIPQATYDEAEFKYNVALDQLAMAESKFTLVTKGARSEELEALEALVKQAQSALAEVEAYDKETVQKAPLAAQVSKVALHPGELASTGFPIVTLVDLQDVWATFAVREDLLRDLKQDAVLQVEIPALGKTVSMKVFSIAAMGDFATWRATGEKDSFDLKSFEVKARPTERVEGLRPGMTARWTPGR